MTVNSNAITSSGYISAFKSNILITFAFCAVFLTFGLSIGFLGPTLWDLGCRARIVLKSSSWLFLAQGLLMLVGNLSAGIILKRIPPLNAALCGVLVIAMMFTLLPFCHNLASLMSILGIMGFCSGIIDTAGNVAMIDTYRHLLSPFLHAMNFFYGLGALLSPLIAAPFLENIDCEDLVANITKTNVPRIEYFHMKNKLDTIEAHSNVNSAFFVMAAIQTALRNVVQGLRTRCMNGPYLFDSMHAIYFGSSSSCITLAGSTVSIIQLLIISAILFMSDGVQASYSGYIFSYGKLMIPNLSSENAAHIDAVFWILFTIGRLIAIPVSFILKPHLIVFADIFLAGWVILAQSLLPVTVMSLYVGAGLIGLLLSSISPASICMAEQMLNLKASATGWLVMIAATGEMLFPILIANELADIGPSSFPLINGGAFLMMLVMLGIVQMITFFVSMSKDDEQKRLIELDYSSAN